MHRQCGTVAQEICREDATRVVVAHVRYRQYGGEDAVFANEIGLLRSAGADVEPLELFSADFDSLSPASKSALLVKYSDHAYARGVMRGAIKRFRPDLVHFHNLYPLLGPGAIAEAHALNCATVHTLHNYRLSCLNGLHHRKQATCNLCRPACFRPGVWHACYRSSRLQSLLTSRATSAEWLAFRKRGYPTLLLALTEFARDKYVEWGADPDRIAVKPNSVPSFRKDTAGGSASRVGVVVAGRLSQEKGIIQLMNAWPEHVPPLTVVGDGPLAAEAAAGVRENVRYLGRLSQQDLRAQLRGARVLAFPSLCYEAMPLIVLEALSEGTPVVSFTGGALDSMGLPSVPASWPDRGDFAALAEAAARVADDADWGHLSERCRSIWRAAYSDEVNTQSLLRHYSYALALNASVPRLRTGER